MMRQKQLSFAKVPLTILRGRDEYIYTENSKIIYGGAKPRTVEKQNFLSNMRILSELLW